MKALLFLPFTFAAGAEGFALFAPYLITVLSLLYFARLHRSVRRPAVALRLAAVRKIELIPPTYPLVRF